MTMMITENCINCGACAVECPTEAIFEPGENWKILGKSFLALSNEHFFIVKDICDECLSLKKIRCISVCPMDSIIMFL
jgi:ferredoxin